MIFDLVKEFADMLDAMPRDHPRHRILKLLDEAVSRDVHFIDRHPTTLFQCLWNSCWWYDCPEAAKHYEEQADRTSAPLPWMDDTLKVSALLEQWKQMAECCGTLRPRLRECTPPKVHLESPQLEVRLGSWREMALSPDDSRLVTVTNSGKIHIWDNLTGRELRVFDAGTHGTNITAIAFFPDSTRIVGATAFWPNYRLKIWNTETGDLLHEMSGHRSWVTSIAVHPGGVFLISGSNDTTVGIWNAIEGKLLGGLCDDVGRVLTGHSVDQVAISPNGELIAAATNDNSVRIWEIAKVSGPPVRRLSPEGIIKCIAFSPDSQSLAVGTDFFGSRLAIWDVATGQRSATFDTDNRQDLNVESLAFAPDGTRIATGSTIGVVRIWDVHSQLLTKVLRGHQMNVSHVAFTSNGRRLVTLSADGSIRFWDTQATSSLRRRRGHTGFVNDVAISHDGRLIASASADATIRLWNFETGEESHVFNGLHGNVVSLAISRNGRQLVSASAEENSVQVWDLDKLKESTVLSRNTDWQKWILRVAFSDDGRRIVGFDSASTIRIWDTETFEEIRAIHVEYVNRIDAIAVSPNGDQICILTHDGSSAFGRYYTYAWKNRAEIWDVDSATIWAMINIDAQKLRFSGDGRRIAFFHSGEWRILDIERGEFAESIKSCSDLGTYDENELRLPYRMEPGTQGESVMIRMADRCEVGWVPGWSYSWKTNTSGRHWTATDFSDVRIVAFE